MSSADLNGQFGLSDSPDDCPNCHIPWSATERLHTGDDKAIGGWEDWMYCSKCKQDLFYPVIHKNKENIMSKIIYVDNHGYTYSIKDGRVYIGLKDSTIQEAIDYFSSPFFPNPAKGAAIVAAIKENKEYDWNNFPKNCKCIYFTNTEIPQDFVFPKGLETIYFNKTIIPSNIVFPDELETIYFVSLTIPEGFTFPNILRYIDLFNTTIPDGIVFPKDCIVVKKSIRDGEFIIE